MEYLVVEDFGPGRTDSSLWLDICPDADDDRDILGNTHASAAGRDFRAPFLAVAMPGKLPCIEEVSVVVPWQVGIGRTCIVFVRDGDDPVQCLGPIHCHVRVDYFAGRLVVGAIDDDEVIITEGVFTVFQVNRIPGIPEGIDLPLDRVISFKDPDLRRFPGHEHAVPMPGDDSLFERLLVLHEVKLPGIAGSPWDEPGHAVRLQGL